MRSRAKIEQDARERAGGDPARDLPALMEEQLLAMRFRDEQRLRILGPHRRGVAEATPRKGRVVHFPKR